MVKYDHLSSYPPKQRFLNVKRFLLGNKWWVLMLVLWGVGSPLYVGADSSRSAEWVTQLPEHQKSYYHHPDISPDDRHTAFSVGASGFAQNTIWIHDSQNGDLTQLTTIDSTMSTGDVMVRWSPSGELLGFASDRGGENHIYVTSVKGGSLRRITTVPLPHGVWNCRFSFSPDGRQIVYSDGENSEHNLFIVNLINGQVEQLTNFVDRSIEGPDWSKDGKSIVYTSANKFYIWDVGSGVESLVETDKEGSYPTWSPDGLWIGFQRMDQGHFKTYLVSRTGGPATMVGPGAGYVSQVPAWSSDGRHLVYHGGKGGKLPLVVTDLADRSEQVLMDSLIHVGWYWGSWSPDSRRLAFMHSKTQNGRQRVEMMLGNIETRAVEPVGQVYPQNESALRQAPVWFADSERFLMITGDSTNSNIALVSVGDLSPQPMTNSRSIKCDMALSPDEELVAFLVKTGADMDIWLFDRITGEEIQLTFNKLKKAQLRFSPDGEQIAFIQDNPNTKYDIMLVSVDGGEPKQISSHPAWELDPQWISDSRISFTTHPQKMGRSLTTISIENESTPELISNSSPAEHIIMPVRSLDHSQLFYQVGWPQGPFMTRDINSALTKELISRVQQPLVSSDGLKVAYLKPEGALQFLWRENVEHIVRPTKLP